MSINMFVERKIFLGRCKESLNNKPGVNFINILRMPFMRSDPKSAKKTDSLTVFFVLLGSACIIVGEIDPC